MQLEEIMPKKVYNILTIICLASIILIPIGLALMWLSTEWKKRTKIMISSVLGLFYITLVVFILLLEPSNNTGELNLPLSYEQSYSEDGASLNESSSKELPSKNKSKKNSKKQTKKSKEQGRLPKSVSKQKGVPLGRLFYSILFFLFMLLLIINQNRKSGKKKFL